MSTLRVNPINTSNVNFKGLAWHKTPRGMSLKNIDEKFFDEVGLNSKDNIMALADKCSGTDCAEVSEKIANLTGLPKLKNIFSFSLTKGGIQLHAQEEEILVRSDADKSVQEIRKSLGFPYKA